MTDKWTGFPTLKDVALELTEQWLSGGVGSCARADVAKRCRRDVVLAVGVAMLIRNRSQGWGAEIEEFCSLMLPRKGGAS